MKKILLTILLIIVFMPHRASADITSNLTGWWKFDDGSGTTAVDSSTGGHNGTLGGATLPTWTAPGRIGPYDLTFNGTTAIVTTGGNFSSYITATDGTVSAWVYPTGAGTGDCTSGQAGTIFEDSVSTGAGGYAWMGWDSASKFCYGNYDGSNDNFISSAQSLNTWYLVTWVHTGGNVIGYINGVQVTTGASGNTGNMSASNVAFGEGYNHDSFFPGQIDDIRTWSRGLSGTEVADLYNSYVTRKAQTGVTSGIVVPGTTATCTFASNPAPGSLIAVGLLFYDGTVSPPTFTVQDANSNIYTNSPDDSGASSMNDAGWIGQAYRLSAPSNADKAITVTFSKTFVVAAIWCDNFTPPTGKTATSDDTAFATGIGTINTPTITVSGYNELVYGTASDSNDVNAVTGAWTQNEGGKNFGNSSEWILDVSANTAVGYAGTAARAYNALGMSFAFSASPPPPPPATGPFVEPPILLE